jgi:hypothetical protein
MSFMGIESDAELICLHLGYPGWALQARAAVTGSGNHPPHPPGLVPGGPGGGKRDKGE